MPRTDERTFTCHECGTTGTLRWMNEHPCGEIADVAEFGGRCEDFPCCGHLPGECAPQERFTARYWQERYDALDPEDRYEVEAFGWPEDRY